MRRGLSKISVERMKRATAQHFAMHGVHQCGKQCAQQIEQALAELDDEDSDLEYALERENELNGDLAEHSPIGETPEKIAGK